MHISDTTRQSHLFLQPAQLLQANIVHCSSSAIPTNFSSLSDLNSITARCEELEKEMEKLSKSLRDFKILHWTLSTTSWIRRHAQRNLEPCCMLAKRTKKRKAEIKSLTLVYAKFVKTWNTIPVSPKASRQPKNSHSVPNHLLISHGEMERKIRSEWKRSANWTISEQKIFAYR